MKTWTVIVPDSNTLLRYVVRVPNDSEAPRLGISFWITTSTQSA